MTAKEFSEICGANVVKLSEVAKHDPPEGMKRVANISTGHLTLEDSELLERLTREEYGEMIGKFDFGWWVEVYWESCVADHLWDLGFSSFYVHMIKTLHEAGFNYACFDQDAPLFEEFEAHVWENKNNQTKGVIK